MSKKVVAISGFFNPLHEGHLDYIEAAKKIGDYLIVIVDNDTQVVLKGSTPFMEDHERVRIISSLEDVDIAVLSVDNNVTIDKTLSIIRPDFFAVGGDHDESNTSEKEICKKLGIKVIYGVGGKKVQSSSWLIQKLKDK